MSRLRRHGALALLAVVLVGCSAGADTGIEGVTGSAVIQQITPSRGHFDDVVVAYGQGAAGSGGSHVLTLPLDATLTSVTVVAGQRVHAGQRLADFVPSKAAEAARVAARSGVTLAREQRERAARLLADHLATADQLGQAEKALRDAEAALNALLTPDNALRAPAEGTVLSIDAQRGALITAGSPLMALGDSNQMGFTGGIEPSDMMRVHIGDMITLEPISGGTPLAAHVSTVAVAVDPATRLVDVRAMADTPLVQGAAYRAVIVVGTLEGWRVPADAVVGDDGAQAVWQVVEGKAHRVPVTLVAQHGDEALVEGKIDPSRPLATVGAPQLDEGMQVRPAASK